MRVLRVVAAGEGTRGKVGGVGGWGGGSGLVGQRWGGGWAGRSASWAGAQREGRFSPLFFGFVFSLFLLVFLFFIYIDSH